MLAWADGLAIRLVPGEQLSRVVFVSGTYEPNTLCVLRRHLPLGGVFIDAGAHAGVVSLAASRWVGRAGRVFALEPSSREHHRLLESRALSHASNVVPVRAAVAAASGRGTLRVADDLHTGLNTMGQRIPYAVAESSRERVGTVAIDDFVRGHSVSRIDAIKLDVEGCEAAALAGAEATLQRWRPMLLVELNAAALAACDASPSDVEAQLRSVGYRCFTIDDEDASLAPLENLTGVEPQNLVFLPRERAA